MGRSVFLRKPRNKVAPSSFRGLAGAGKEVKKMSDLMAQPDKLRANAAECAVIRDLATDQEKRELFARLAAHLSALAAEMERASPVPETRIS